MTPQEAPSSSTQTFEPKLPGKPGKANRKVESIRNCYYRKPDGYIHASYGHETMQARALIAAGQEHLDDKYAYTDERRTDGSSMRIDYTADENKNPLFWFLKNGGIPLLTVEQLLEQNWDVNPPYDLPVEAFPQLEGNIPQRWACTICGPEEPGKVLHSYRKEQHLRAHLRVGHQLRMNEVADEIANVKAARAEQPTD